MISFLHSGRSASRDVSIKISVFTSEISVVHGAGADWRVALETIRFQLMSINVGPTVDVKDDTVSVAVDI